MENLHWLLHQKNVFMKSYHDRLKYPSYFPSVIFYMKFIIFIYTVVIIYLYTKISYYIKKNFSFLHLNVLHNYYLYLDHLVRATLR
jgi:hypothetical protein